jgi:hypothetical protein
VRARRNVYRTPIANRGRPIEWSSYFRYAAPPSGDFRFRSVFTTSKSANNSRTARAGRIMSTENELQSGVGLSIGQVTSAGWRHLPPIPVSGPFSRLVKALITRKRQELDEECLHNTNSKSESTYRTVKLLPLGVAICRRFPLPVGFR